ncbi:hypothetical protein Cni_G10501 [Canna indica]|uniref:Uncharacterized protein n=1 Tax=Canna indica TaxID=4628 RepID=A0AAQ3Q8M4_9LILI|nr:hypothetical protein Cni_G10501 [Canna indica]
MFINAEHAEAEERKRESKKNKTDLLFTESHPQSSIRSKPPQDQDSLPTRKKKRAHQIRSPDQPLLFDQSCRSGEEEEHEQKRFQKRQ